MQLNFTIPGAPKAKGRPRLGRNGTYTPKETVEYENLVKLSFMQQCHGKLTGAISATIIAQFPIPKSASRKARAAMLGGEIVPTKKPDLDNIAKAILDSLNGLAYDDDSAVVALRCSKTYSATPRVIVLLECADREV